MGSLECSGLPFCYCLQNVSEQGSLVEDCVVNLWTVYKPPIASKSPAKFFYMDGSLTNWTLSPLPIDNDAAGVGATLREFYKHDQRHFSFAYNDDSPSGSVDSYRGHSKGVVLFDDETGFWIIHSVPNFPSIGSYSYPATGMKFGQTFLCLTLSSQSLGDVGEHLRYVQATPFFSNLPEPFSVRFPVLVNIVKKQSLSKSETVFTRVRQFTTVGGQSLKSFAKHKKFNKDLWFDFVAPELRINMAVESWLNGGADDLDSVYDVTSVALPGVSFNSSRDHSKWAVADSNGPNIVCIGDMNRQV
ncbi:deoxyribonuclease-2 domain protein [Ancylostoma ceylanicum]|uniref:Deoxyribonuclease-2 domain protein n=1 Tax=Ancylostoma ceylanicum TaxID=53326 RepID=A0A0D6MAG3_9BILA|nr:deoxyribonuclease-2 domain protein [Ancylostoma ceylanicum]